MADIDDDDDLDLLVGDDYGNIKLFLRDGDELSFEENLQADGEDLDVIERATPRLVDWDLDDDLDLIVGSSTGLVFLYMNIGNAEEYEFTDGGFICAGETEIWLGSETCPAFGDLDGDGNRDLLVGSVWGELWFYPNTGENDDPTFGEGVQVQEQTEEDTSAVMLGQYTRPVLVDWEGDGDMDILTGLVDPEIRLFIDPAGGLPEITVDPDTLEFGEIYTGVGQNRTLTIGNIGNDDLTVYDIAAEGDYFRVSFDGEFTVEPEGSHDVTVIFEPTETGEFTGILTITSNDPDNAELSVYMHGIGLDQGVGDELLNPVPDCFYISSAYPNPFNSVTRLSFGLPVASMISISVFDIYGERVLNPIRNRLMAGRYDLALDASELESGTYFVRMVAGNFSATKKIVLVR